MNWDKFAKELQAMVHKLDRSVQNDILLKIESAGLRFIDDNFRNQGWEGQAWKQSDGTILVKTGALRRDFSAISGDKQVRFVNRLPYAAINNEGFDGQVNIPKHTRSIYAKAGRKMKKTGIVSVKAHKRHMKIHRRQFAPYPGSPSPTLNRLVKNIIQTELFKILTP